MTGNIQLKYLTVCTLQHMIMYITVCLTVLYVNMFNLITCL